MANKRWRVGVDQLTPYVPGKPIEDVKRELGLEEVIRLASNENPFGPSLQALAAMAEAVQESWLYPEPTCRELREKLGEQLQVSSEEIIVGNGADHIITLIGNAYISPGDEVIYCNPTFSSYRAITLLMGGIPVEVPATPDYVCDLDGIMEAVTAKTKLIFICNPNNPTGTVVEPDKLTAFLERLPEHVLVILDEAYIEYLAIENYRTGIDYIRQEYPVISIRTFSKYYGLAGVRIGYAVARERYLEPVQAVKQVFAVNRIAIAGALAALDDAEHGKRILTACRQEMSRVSRACRELGYDVTESHANFLFVDLKRDATELFTELMKKGVLIRPCAAWNLNTHARITIGTVAQNDKLLTSLQEIQQAYAR